MHPKLDFIEITVLFGILQGLLLLYFFITKPLEKANVYLLLLMIALVILEAEVFLNRSGYMLFTLHFLNVSAPLLLLIGPVGYLYTATMLERPIPIKRQILHFLPALVYFFYSFFFFLQPWSLKYNAYVRSYQPEQALLPVKINFPIDPLDIQGIIIMEGVVLQMISYAIFGFYLLYNYLKSTHKKSEKQTDWLLLVNGVLLSGGILLFLSEGGIINGHVFFKAPLPHNAGSIMPCILVYAMSFLLIKDSVFFKKTETKYQKSELPEALKIKYLQKIQATLENEKPYLRANFSLADLARCTGLKTHHISQVINSQLHLSFYELVNVYRIEEAQKILQQSTDILKMEPLAYQLGYKSKSAFFISFKKHTAVTPGEYRKQYSLVK